MEAFINYFTLGFILSLAVVMVIVCIRGLVQTEKEYHQNIKEIESRPPYGEILDQHRDHVMRQALTLCRLAGIKVTHVDGDLISTDGKKDAGQFIERTTYYPGRLGLYDPEPQDVSKSDYKRTWEIKLAPNNGATECWILLHELGHWIASIRNEPGCEEDADHYADELAQLLLPPEEYEFLKEYIKIWFHSHDQNKEETTHDIEGSEHLETRETGH